MRLSRFTSTLFGAFALVAVALFPGCQNPFDPLDQSEEIEGLSHFSFGLTWDLWDSDPAYDGVTLELDYYNTLHETLDFHDKPHTIVVEFWSQQDLGEADESGKIENSYYAKDKLLYSKSITYVNSDDIIHIPIESYYQYIPEPEEVDDGTGTTATTTTSKKDTDYFCYVVVKVYPPKESPQKELLVAENTVKIYVPSDTVNGINE